MREVPERMALQVAGLLVILGFVSSFVLWTIDTASASGEALFALYMSMDLVSFAMISYVYRGTKRGEGISRVWMIVGFCLLLVLVGAGFAYASPPY